MISPSLLASYGDLAVSVALNLQPGQRLLIICPLANGGCSLDPPPLVRAVTDSAYRNGASFVEAIWGDEPMQLSRFRQARNDTFGLFSNWLPDALLHHVEGGHAVLSIYANDPDLLKAEDPAVVGAVQQVVGRDRKS